MPQAIILMQVTGKNGQIVLQEEIVKIVRINNNDDEKSEDVFPILKISSIQLDKTALLTGDKYIHFTLLGEREAKSYKEASKGKYCIIFSSNQQAEFEQIKLSTERQMSLLRSSLLNRPEIKQIEAEIESQKTEIGIAALLEKNTQLIEQVEAKFENIETKTDIGIWLEKNTKLIEQGIESLNNFGEEWAKIKHGKLSLEKQELEVSDEQHRRSLFLLTAIITFIFILCMVAIFKGQYELVKWILGSSFAVAAGAGLKELLGKKNK